MHNIKCPNCGAEFSTDQAGYAELLRQVRTETFEREVKKQVDLLANQQKLKYEQDIQQRDMQHKQDLQQAQSKYSQEIQKMDAQYKQDLQQRHSQHYQEMQQQKAQYDQSIQRLQYALKTAENEKATAVQISDAKHKVELDSMRQSYETQMKLKDDEIAYYKDFKARQSTKMIGESLEQHCLMEFNRYRSAMFPNAYFEKDNDARSGSKGDFIFRQSTQEGIEFLSIMFEMKNEMDTTATKHKNEDFFKELDKDRREKNCEYAVLVSLLEADSEVYNQGIVDVSYRYPKMYVIRPQFFIPMITILRSAAINSIDARRQMAQIKHEYDDVYKFKTTLDEFKDKFTRNTDLAKKHFDEVVDGLDKTINYLQKVKQELLATSNQLRLADNKLQDLTIEKLTKGNPTMRAKFEKQIPIIQQ